MDGRANGGIATALKGCPAAVTQVSPKGKMVQLSWIGKIAIVRPISPSSAYISACYASSSLYQNYAGLSLEAMLVGPPIV